MRVLLEFSFVKKNARKCSSKIVNNFECMLKTYFERKLSQEFFAKTPFLKNYKICDFFCNSPSTCFAYSDALKNYFFPRTIPMLTFRFRFQRENMENLDREKDFISST